MCTAEPFCAYEDIAGLTTENNKTEGAPFDKIKTLIIERA